MKAIVVAVQLAALAAAGTARATGPSEERLHLQHRQGVPEGPERLAVDRAMPGQDKRKVAL
jgi:hypothetical protein